MVYFDGYSDHSHHTSTHNLYNEQHLIGQNDLIEMWSPHSIFRWPRYFVSAKNKLLSVFKAKNLSSKDPASFPTVPSFILVLEVLLPLFEVVGDNVFRGLRLLVCSSSSLYQKC